MIHPLLKQALDDSAALIPKLRALDEPLQKLADMLLGCWARRGKVLICGNGGSAADAMHFAEELVVRFAKNRRALAAIALTDPTVLTCCGNDFGFDQIFERQVDALGNPGDVLIVMTTSGNSENILRALNAAKKHQLFTVAFLGKGGGKTKDLCDIELLIPSANTARIQEAHKLLFHVLCEWVDAKH